MTYRILARKTRPQDFSAVLGQEATVQALRNALGAGKVASAYLFSGIRGVGKTSVARIFAKALNCENGPASDPCNECVVCREITAGSDLDVLEIDAATYSKVEQVRELTESLKYGPARDRYKVVILDEIHRLSRQAFDALLKIVEEPPEHLVFLFATTEAHAVPATILSRCQEFNFRRVPFQALVDHLRSLCTAEGFEATDTALRLIARAGDGSVRDAVALLDQLSIYGSGKIQDEDASHLLGGLDAALYHGLLAAILAGDGSVVLRVVAEIEAAGWDPRLAFAEFLAYCRDALHLSLGGSVDQVDLPRDEAQALAELAKRPEAGRKNLLRLLHHLLQSENTVRRTEAGALALEIVWLRMAELPQLSHIEDLLGGDGRPSGLGAEPQSQSAKATVESSNQGAAVAPAAPPDPAAPSARTPDEPLVTNQTPEALEATPADSSSTSTNDRIRELLLQVSRRKQSLAAHLAGADRLDFSDDELRIHMPPRDSLLKNALERRSNRQVLEDCVKQTWTQATRWRTVESSASDPAVESEETERVTPSPDPAMQHPTVQAALDIFGGAARAVGPDDT